MNYNLIDTIKEDCEYYHKIANRDTMHYSYLKLQELNNSNESNLYQLCLNGTELWYGTLEEINAIVKSMIRLIEYQEEFGLDL